MTSNACYNTASLKSLNSLVGRDRYGKHDAKSEKNFINELFTAMREQNSPFPFRRSALMKIMKALSALHGNKHSNLENKNFK